MDDDKKDEDKNNAIGPQTNGTPALRVVLGDKARVTPIIDQIAANQQQAAIQHHKMELVACLNNYLQLALEGKIEMVAIAAKLRSAPNTSEVRTEIAPSNFDRFSMIGIMHSMLHFETQKLKAAPNMPPPPTEPPKGA